MTTARRRIGFRRRVASASLLACAALLGAACGGDDSDPAGLNRTVGGDGESKRGGELRVLSAGDVTSLDPGYWYYGYDYQALAQPTQRALYGFEPDAARPSPDLAAAMPQTSQDGRTVTIKIKSDIHYSPPLQDRTVKSEDVKYAIERAFLPSVANGYVSTYFGAISGLSTLRSGDAGEISGIETPDDTTLVLRLKQPVGVISNAQALALPVTVPVPRDHAARHDQRATSTYGSNQVFTGPYMIRSDARGKVLGYQRNRRIELVRNPSWDPKTDHRPAYLDRITLLGGNDIDLASRRVLGGKSLASGDFAAPPVNLLRSALSTRRDQLAIVPSQGIRYIALNTKVKPFHDTNVRRAVGAAIDRRALRLTRGGPPLGRLATHFLPPGVPAFEQAGGRAGTLDFMTSTRADLRLARSYLRRAGYAGGRYSGPPLLMVGDDQLPGSRTAEVVRAQLARLGFRFELRRSAAFADACSSPSARVAVCPNAGWGKDFFDPQSVLEPVFYGENVGAGSANWSQVQDPELDAGFDIAASETDAAEREELYGEIDRTVTSRAYAIPWLWDNQINAVASNVKGVVSRFTVSWDLSYMSLK